MSSPPPPPPELIEDSTAEILLRLPPDDPACLVRASLVCKLWRRILSESTFPHRYREFHQTPPLLGFLRSTFCSASGRFIPATTRIPFRQPPFACRALDCRHGRVLFDTTIEGPRGSHFAVWDPITGDHKVLRDPNVDSYSRSGVVLCAAAGCSHRACQDGPFIVVVVKLDSSKAASAWVYSSKSDAWSAPATLQLPEVCDVNTKRGAIVGDQIYILPNGTVILKYDIGKHCLNMIPLPRIDTNCRTCTGGILMTMDDGSSLGYVVIMDSTLHMWARKVNPDGSMGWVKDRLISLDNLVPIIPYWPGYISMIVMGFAEGMDFLLLRDGGSSFIFELKSGRLKKLSNPELNFDVIPYLNFYIPDFDSRKSPLPMETKL